MTYVLAYVSSVFLTERDVYAMPYAIFYTCMNLLYCFNIVMNKKSNLFQCYNLKSYLLFASVLC